jgi:pimeloyl-ACP methyl ester carboxylesterase
MSSGKGDALPLLLFNGIGASRELLQPFVAEMRNTKVGWSSLPWLHKLKQPTLILAGDYDPIIPMVNARIICCSSR